MVRYLGMWMAMMVPMMLPSLVPMAAVTVAIAAERLAPAPVRVAQVAGAALVVVGVRTIAGVPGTP